MSHELVDPITHQFFCELHNYGWSMESDGSDPGCVVCHRRGSFIENLRELATFLETNDAVPCPLDLSALVSIPDRDTFLCAARSIGFAAKEFNEQWVSLKKRFGAVTYEIFTQRDQFCTRKVVSTRTVPEHTEDIVEWECKDSLFQQESK